MQDKEAMEKAKQRFFEKWLGQGHYGISVQAALDDGFEAGYQAALAANEWVPITERLPEKEGNYLTFCAYYAPDDIPTDYDIKRFVTGPEWGDFIGNGRVIAWREIPPYQPNEQNGGKDE